MNGENEISAITTYAAADTEALVQKVVAARLPSTPAAGQWTLRINVSLTPSGVGLPGDDTRDPGDVPPEEEATVAQKKHVRTNVTGSNSPVPSVLINGGKSLPTGITNISMAVTFGEFHGTSRPGTPGDDTKDPGHVPDEE